MDKQIVQLHELIDEMTDKGIARSSITIGKRAQEYGQNRHITAARKMFSFSVDSNRLSDISFSARSHPDYNGFIKSRIGIWWWSDPAPEHKSTYVETIRNKIEKAQKKGLVDFPQISDQKRVIIPGENTTKILEKIGGYNREVFDKIYPYMSRKIRSAFGSYITDLN